MTCFSFFLSSLDFNSCLSCIVLSQSKHQISPNVKSMPMLCFIGLEILVMPSVLDIHWKSASLWISSLKNDLRKKRTNFDFKYSCLIFVFWVRSMEKNLINSGKLKPFLVENFGCTFWNLDNIFLSVVKCFP